jgi:hypothetical protein
MSDRSDYRLGSIWVINFDPSVGTEIRKTRSGLVIAGTVILLATGDDQRLARPQHHCRRRMEKRA